MTVMAPARPQRFSLVCQEHAELPANLRAVPEARRLVRDAIRAWGLPVDSDVADVAFLLTSEVVANAVTHGSESASATIRLSVDGAEGRLLVEVDDTSFDPPVVRNDPPSGSEHGRGMLLVDALASAWGYRFIPTGKTVYFTLAF